MAKQDSIKAKGKITQALSNGTFSVQLDNVNTAIYCTLGGSIRKNFIRVMPGDEVGIEMSPYDLTKGRIVRLFRKNSPSPTGPTHRRYKK